MSGTDWKTYVCSREKEEAWKRGSGPLVVLSSLLPFFLNLLESHFSRSYALSVFWGTLKGPSLMAPEYSSIVPIVLLRSHWKPWGAAPRWE